MAALPLSSANNGFQHQRITDVAMDREHPERALVVLTFDNDAFLGHQKWRRILDNSWPRTETHGSSPRLCLAKRLVGFTYEWRVVQVRRNCWKWTRAGLYVADPVGSRGSTRSQ